jgi:hypothetical protein
MNNKNWIFSFALILVSMAVACSSGGSTPGNTPMTTSPNPDAGSTPETGGTAATVTFTQVYTEIISVSCLPCHAAGQVGASAGALDMSNQSLAYTNLQKTATGSSCASNGLTLVVPGDAAVSLLAQKVQANPPCGLQMPYGCGTSAMPCLSADQVQEIVTWINEGAQND